MSYYHYYKIYKQNVRVPKHETEISAPMLMALLIEYANNKIDDYTFTDDNGNIDYDALDREFSKAYTEADNAIDTEDGLDCGDFILIARYEED